MEAVLSQKSMPAFIFDEMAGFNLKPIDKTKDEKEFPPASSNIINEKEVVDNNTSLNGNQKSRAALIGKTWYTPQYEEVIYKFYEQIISIRKKGQEKRRKKTEELSEAEELEETDETDSLEDELDESEKKEKEEEEKGLFEKIEDFLEQFEDEDGPLKRRRRKRKGVRGYLRDKLEEKWDDAKKRFKQKYIDPWTERAKNSLNEKIGKYKKAFSDRLENVKKKFGFDKLKGGKLAKIVEKFKNVIKKIANFIKRIRGAIQKFLGKVLKPLKWLAKIKKDGLLKTLLKNHKKIIKGLMKLTQKYCKNKVVRNGVAMVGKFMLRKLPQFGAKALAKIGAGSLFGGPVGTVLMTIWTVGDMLILAWDIYKNWNIISNIGNYFNKFTESMQLLGSELETNKNEILEDLENTRKEIINPQLPPPIPPPSNKELIDKLLSVSPQNESGGFIKINDLEPLDTEDKLDSMTVLMEQFDKQSSSLENATKDTHLADETKMLKQKISSFNKAIKTGMAVEDGSKTAFNKVEMIDINKQLEQLEQKVAAYQEIKKEEARKDNFFKDEIELKENEIQWKFGVDAPWLYLFYKFLKVATENFKLISFEGFWKKVERELFTKYFDTVKLNIKKENNEYKVTSAELTKNDLYYKNKVERKLSARKEISSRFGQKTKKALEDKLKLLTDISTQLSQALTES